MGFFKKIGKAIKKNVSFKNLVKLGTPLLSAIPIAGGFAQNIVGGLSEAHEAKKLQKQAEAAGNAQLAQQYAEQVKLSTQASGGQMGSIVGTVAGQFGKSVLEGSYESLGNGVKSGVANVGADVANLTITAWFKKHWWKVGAGLGVLAGVIFFATRGGKRGRR